MRAASTIATVTATAAAAVLFGTLGNADAGNVRPHHRVASHQTHQARSVHPSTARR